MNNQTEQGAAYGTIAERAQAGLDAGWWTPKADMLVNGGALQMALNILKRGTSVQQEAAAELEKTARPAVPTSEGYTSVARPAAAGHIAQPYTLDEIEAKIASGDYSAELLLQHAMLLLTAAAIPAGYALVPLEPTEEMLAAAHEGDRQYTLRTFGDVMTVMQGPYDHWCAMVAAATAKDKP